MLTLGWCRWETIGTSLFMNRRLSTSMRIPPQAAAVAFMVSLAANVVLIVTFGMLELRQPDTHAPLPVKTVNTTAKPAHATNPATIAPKFHWRQLDAPDFVGFVANLRAIGCPEATIRDIVDGELREIDAVQAADGSASTLPASASAAHFERTIAAREQHRMQLLASILSANSTASSPTAPAQGPDLSKNAAVAMSKAQVVQQIPAVFQVGNDPALPAPGSPDGSQELSTVITDSSIDPETAGQLTRMRQDFAESVSQTSSNVDPNSREYIREWWRAKRESDDRFSSMFGGEALNNIYRQSMLSLPPPGAVPSQPK